MSSIVLIAPNLAVASTAEKAKKKYNLDLDIHVGLMDEGVEIAEKLIKQGTKVIISRGGTAILLRKKWDLQVVEIKMVLDDAVSAIKEASKFGKKIQFVGFSNHLKGFDSLGPLLGLEIQQSVLEDWKDAKPQIMEAQQKGVNVIVGGAFQNKIAAELGMPSIFLSSSESAIYLAYSEAMALLNVILSKERSEREFQEILDYSGDGFVAIDNFGQITLVNNFIKRVFQTGSEELTGKNIKESLPLIGNLVDFLNPDVQASSDVINTGDYTLLYNRIRLVNDDVIVGAMATLKDIRQVQAEDQRIRLKQYADGLYAKYNFSDLIGSNIDFVNSKKMAESFAKTDSTILITSESGTGKELFAQAIHNASPRAKGPFVAINCASLAESILESELFGYVEGAFTGTRKSGKPGVFEMAKGGTIFLDEIGELPVNLQSKLLRVLQERSVMRLGDDKIIPVDVRVIAATNRNLVENVKGGTFRKDLFFRLNVLRLTLPPLNKRGDDLLQLASFFLKKHGVEKEAPLSEDVTYLLQNYSWPGNIRELENLMERVAVLGQSNDLFDIICEHIREFDSLDDSHKENLTVDSVVKALTATKGSKTKAAKLLGVHRSTLWRFLDDHPDVKVDKL
ncbi:MAG: AAA family ATPase [Acidaminobacter sp.]|uniref:sigma 54-interacting transcriptional regulator n=1 Tax=Acidaminobacter sp. TaxID=1872102 RepID=UPI00138322B7|nr:sigma 54-interacting transcriptional regulator [Acidaminobacter sp.]MZQ98392.1 AAA family ATPase [Acidaminobacter sp.]